MERWRLWKIYIWWLYKYVDVETGRIENIISFEQKSGGLKELISQGIHKLVKKIKEEIKLKTSLNVQFSFMAIRGNESFTVQSGDTLLSGDNIHITVVPSQRCYIYIINQDAKGEVYSLFPNPAQRYRALNAGVEYHIPGNDLSFELDENTGKESLYLIASLNPIKDIEKIVFTSTKNVSEKQKLFGVISSRGFAKIMKGNKTAINLKSGKSFNSLADLLYGNDAFRHIIVFEHVSR